MRMLDGLMSPWTCPFRAKMASVIAMWRTMNQATGTEGSSGSGSFHSIAYHGWPFHVPEPSQRTMRPGSGWARTRTSSARKSSGAVRAVGPSRILRATT